jgi:hypothetical protein
MRHKPGHIRLVHGEATAKVALQEALRKVCPESRVVVVDKAGEDRDEMKSRPVDYVPPG